MRLTGRFIPPYEDKLMTTGKKAASAAGKTLNNPKATKSEKRAAASDLAQARKK